MGTHLYNNLKFMLMIFMLLLFSFQGLAIPSRGHTSDTSLTSDNTHGDGCNQRKSYQWKSADDPTAGAVGQDDAPPRQRAAPNTSTFSKMPYIFFVHLRKTGGSTVEYTLLREAKGTARLTHLKTSGKENPEPGKFHKFRWFQSNGFGKIGHYDFKDLHHVNRVDKGRPYAYISVLRNPVHRVVSSYWFWHRFWRYMPLMVNDDGSSKMTLTEFVMKGHAKNNHQFHALKGPKDVTVDDVLATLRERFLVVGVIEEFDRFMFLLEQSLGLNAHYEKHNIGNYSHRPDTTEEEQRVIRDANLLDMQLWEGAKDLAVSHMNCYSESDFQEWERVQIELQTNV